MRGLLRFIGSSFAGALGRTIFQVVFLALGVSAPNIIAQLRAFPMVPSYILDSVWAFQLGFFLLSMLIMASIFYSRVEWFRNLRPLPDITVKDAIDYIVNDSRATLKRSAGPQLLTSGPAAGQMATEKGVEHVDALRQFSERVIAGDVAIFGYRQTDHRRISPIFENTIRELAKDYFRHARIEVSVMWHYSKNSPDTTPDRGLRDLEYRYSGIMTFREQVRRAWPPKSIMRNIWARKIRRKPRITYY